MTGILILGATSTIAEHTARLWAARNARLFLAARDQATLAAIARDLEVRGGAVTTAAFEALDTAGHAALLDEAFAALGAVDIVLLAYGSLSNQTDCSDDAAVALRELSINATSAIALLTDIAHRMAARGRGTIAMITSVAGDRGRQSNYVYGAAKAMATVFLQGLRNRLARQGVHVLTIKPGLVDTRMTAHIAGKGRLWSQPDEIAAGIVRAIDRRKDVVYLPWFWRPIMAAVRLVPEPIFKRLSL